MNYLRFFLFPVLALIQLPAILEIPFGSFNFFALASTCIMFALAGYVACKSNGK